MCVCKYKNLFDNIKTRVGNQRLGDADAFGGLIVLQEGGHDAGQRKITRNSRLNYCKNWEMCPIRTRKGSGKHERIQYDGANEREEQGNRGKAGI